MSDPALIVSICSATFTGGGLVAQYLLYRFNGARLKVPLVFCYRADWGLTMSCTGPRRRISFQRSRKDHHIDLGIEDASPDVSPRYATDLRGLPDTLILSAGYDPLKDEAQAYADQLQRAGTKVRRLRYSETIHGFLRFRGPLEAARTAALEIGRPGNRHFRSPGSRRLNLLIAHQGAQKLFAETGFREILVAPVSWM